MHLVVARGLPAEEEFRRLEGYHCLFLLVGDFVKHTKVRVGAGAASSQLLAGWLIDIVC